MPRAKKKVHSGTEQEFEQFIVAINDDFYLNWKGDDWTEKLLYARRFTRPNEASSWAEDAKAKHPHANIRICRLWMAFVVTELTSL